MRSPQLPRLTTLELLPLGHGHEPELVALSEALSRCKADPSDSLALAALLKEVGRDAPEGDDLPAVAVPELAARLRDGRGPERLAAAAALGRRKRAAVPALPALLRLLFAADASLRDAACHALAAVLPHTPVRVRNLLCPLANPLGSSAVFKSVSRRAARREPAGDGTPSRARPHRRAHAAPLACTRR